MVRGSVEWGVVRAERPAWCGAERLAASGSFRVRRGDVVNGKIRHDESMRGVVQLRGASASRFSFGASMASIR